MGPDSQVAHVCPQGTLQLPRTIFSEQERTGAKLGATGHGLRFTVGWLGLRVQGL